MPRYFIFVCVRVIKDKTFYPDEISMSKECQNDILLEYIEIFYFLKNNSNDFFLNW